MTRSGAACWLWAAGRIHCAGREIARLPSAALLQAPETLEAFQGAAARGAAATRA